MEGEVGAGSADVVGVLGVEVVAEAVGELPVCSVSGVGSHKVLPIQMQGIFTIIMNNHYF